MGNIFHPQICRFYFILLYRHKTCILICNSNANQKCWVRKYLWPIYFFLNSMNCSYVCRTKKVIYVQFLEISKQMEPTGEVSNVEQKNLYNALLYKKNLLMFNALSIGSIWFKISISWPTKSQGPKKKCTHFIRERIHSWPVDTIRT